MLCQPEPVLTQAVCFGLWSHVLAGGVFAELSVVTESARKLGSAGGSYVCMQAHAQHVLQQSVPSGSL